jgi:hypothetical protein
LHNWSTDGATVSATAAVKAAAVAGVTAYVDIALTAAAAELMFLLSVMNLRNIFNDCLRRSIAGHRY